MNKQFVTLDIALKLKELGLDEPCLAYYTTTNPVTLDRDGNLTNFVLLSLKRRGELVGHGTCKNSLFQWLKDNDKTSGECYTLSNAVAAPLWQQAVDWLREEHKIQILQTCPIPPEAIKAAKGNLDDKKGFGFYIYSIDWNPRISNLDIWNEDFYEAREAAILNALELIEKK